MRKLLSVFINPFGHFPLHAASSGDHLHIITNLSQSTYTYTPLAFDFATLLVIFLVILLSFLSLSFIFHLRIRSRTACQLREFNNLWTVRVLLVLFISYWSINEIIHLPFFRRHYQLTLSQQDNLCKLHVVFSLGFLEPGFLITLLFLINQSVKEQPRTSSELWSVLSVLLMSLPMLVLEIISVFFTPFKDELDSNMIQTSVLTVDGDGNKKMVCTFPLVGDIVFGVFVIIYSGSLVLSCWRVVALVINKRTRLRVSLLGLSVIISLLVQSICLGMLALHLSGGGLGVWHSWGLFGMFVSLAMSGSVAEIVLVIKPIMEALMADGDNCKWNPMVGYLQLVKR